MSLLNKLTVKNLLLNKKRTIVTIIGIILSTALICAVASIYNSTIASLINYETSIKGNYHVSFDKVDYQDIEKFQKNRKIEKIFYVKNLGYSKIESSNIYKPYLYLIAMNHESINNLALNLIEGRYPENNNEIVIPEHLKSNGKVNLKIGDTITLNIGNRLIDNYSLNQNNPYSEEEKLDIKEEKTYKIVGIIDRPNTSIEPYSAPGYTIVTMDNNDKGTMNLYTRFNREGLNDIYKVTANILGVNEELFEMANNTNITINSKDLEQYYNELANAKYDYTVNNYLIMLETNPLNASTASSLGIVVIIVWIIIMVTSIFCIKNSFDISITEKIRQYGMMRSVGATKKQIRKNVFYEAFILGLIGIPLGIIFGVLASYILIIVSNYYLSNSIGNNLVLIFQTSFMAIIISIILAVITIILSSLKSAIKASLISPIDAIRNSGNIKINKKKIKSSKLINNLFGIGGIIGIKNLKRNRKKYRTTSISIIVSVMVFIGLTSFINLAFKEVNDEYKDYNYNIYLSYNTKDVNKLFEIATLNNINKYSITRNHYITIVNPLYNQKYFDLTKPGGTFEDISIISMPKEYYQSYLKEIGVKDDLYGKAILINNIRYNEYSENGKIIERYNLEKYNYNIGDNIELQNEKESFNIEIGYLTNIRPFGYDTNLFNAFLILDDEFYNKITNDNSYDLFIDSSDAAKVQNDIEKILGKEEYRLNNIDDSIKKMNNLFTLIAIFLYGFIIVIALIGITNIFNTITTNMNLRRREFAILKSIGMTKKEFTRMINLESIFMGVKSLLYGIPLGIGLSYIIYYYFSKNTYLTYYFPLKGIIISVIVVYLLLTIIMHYSIKKVNKQNIMETIRCENI